MLTHTNPLAAKNNLADYLILNLHAFPEYLRPRAAQAVREVDPATSMLDSMEIALAAVLADQAPNRIDALNALHSVATVILEVNLQQKADRAYAIRKYVVYAAGEWNPVLDPPETPEPDPQFRDPEVVAAEAAAAAAAAEAAMPPKLPPGVATPPSKPRDLESPPVVDPEE